MWKPFLQLKLIVTVSGMTAVFPPNRVLLDVLDAMEEVMTGKGEFDRTEFFKIVLSFRKFDHDLFQSQESGWRGLISYYQAGGGDGDPWGGNPSSYLERNATHLRFAQNQSLLVFESCNFASNIAYYQLNIAIASYKDWNLPRYVVRGLAQSSAGLALGSAFWHGSHTRLGGLADNTLLKMMALILHQASLERLPASVKTPVLMDLKDESRNLTGVQMSQLVTDMFREEQNDRWQDILSSLDLPSYQTTYAAIISSFITLLLPNPVVEPSAIFFLDFFRINPSTSLFIIHSYLPQIKQAFSRIQLSSFNKIALFFSTTATFKKLVYAFLFQEQSFMIELLKSPLANQLGALFQPQLNNKSESLSKLDSLSEKLSNGQGIYPGDTWCKYSQPHSLWHGQSAAGLIDLFLLVDMMASLLGQ